jgi:DNA-binding CsgD family transcriptional regulator
MNRQVIVIHPSELVQKGIETILSDISTGQTTLLQSCSQLVDYNMFCAAELLVFTDEANAVLFKQQFWPQYSKMNNKVHHFTISASGAESETIISLYEPIASIISKIETLIKRRNDKHSVITDLSERELEVLKLVALGHQNKEIADKLFISIHTVISHRKNITDKLGIKSISGLTVYAILNKLIDTEHIDPKALL